MVGVNIGNEVRDKIVEQFLGSPEGRLKICEALRRPMLAELQAVGHDDVMPDLAEDARSRLRLHLGYAYLVLSHMVRKNQEPPPWFRVLVKETEEIVLLS